MDKSMAKNYVFEKRDERWEENTDLRSLEFWKYDSKLFAKEEVVDPISLYMTLTGTEDERLEEALEEMMEAYKW